MTFRFVEDLFEKKNISICNYVRKLDFLDSKQDLSCRFGDVLPQPDHQALHLPFLAVVGPEHQE